jgi:hypothetical protein
VVGEANRRGMIVWIRRWKGKKEEIGEEEKIKGKTKGIMVISTFFMYYEKLFYQIFY